MISGQQILIFFVLLEEAESYGSGVRGEGKRHFALRRERGDGRVCLKARSSLQHNTYIGKREITGLCSK